jgi:NAD(P)-dependent dehydrogenase (short-subunit alcohol dehydrogenase family)
MTDSGLGSRRPGGGEKLALVLDLTGKVGVVTGGSRGIGRAICHAFAAAGADVVVASRKLDQCESVAADIEARYDVKALPVAANVSNWDDCERLLAAVYEWSGHCEILVNNAGLSPLYGDLLSVTEALYDKTHNVNARGPFRLSALFGARMAAGQGGLILQISSTTTYRPDPSALPYEMAKMSLQALTCAIIGAYQPKVRANTIVPGAFATDVTEAWPDSFKAAQAESNPLRRMGVPDDVANLCVFLASDAGYYVNGAEILLDGGALRR